MLSVLLSLPTAGDILSNTGAYSTSFFSDLVLIGLAAAGIFIGVIAVSWLGRVVYKAVSKLFKRGGGGRRRRR